MRSVQFCPLCVKVGYALLGDRRHLRSNWHQKEMELFMGGFIRNNGAVGYGIYTEIASIIVAFWGMMIYNHK